MPERDGISSAGTDLSATAKRTNRALREALSQIPPPGAYQEVQLRRYKGLYKGWPALQHQTAPLRMGCTSTNT